MNTRSLTNLSVAGGCGCKQQEDALSTILKVTKQKTSDLSVVVGFETSDDCAVYDMGTDEYLLFTTDFFTPIVDDPYTYGVVAAANAVSDIYAMGGQPFIANTILGYPKDHVSSEDIKKIIKGGTETLDRSKCLIVGGHTIENPQPFYGFTILGKVKKDHLKRNNEVQDGDLLILTKPLGIGIYSNAMKLGLLNDYLYQAMLPVITKVNTEGTALASIKSVHAMTDLTGFGLIGHVLEMCQLNNLKVEITIDSVPLLPEVEKLASAVISPTSGIMKNFYNYKRKVKAHKRLDLYASLPFYDPQSNGGLLIAASEAEIETVLKLAGSWAKVIGRFSKSTFNGPFIQLK